MWVCAKCSIVSYDGSLAEDKADSSRALVFNGPKTTNQCIGSQSHDDTMQFGLDLNLIDNVDHHVMATCT
jgi:hypothetical protein